MKTLPNTLCVLMYIVGAIFFMLPYVITTHPRMLPDSFEWPPGYCPNVVTTADGRHIVPNEPAGRIQIYGSDWHFIRGWNLPDRNMAFLVMPFVEDGQQIKVVAHDGGKGNDEHRLAVTYLFDMSGKLLSREPFHFSRAEYEDMPRAGNSVWVPTRFWLVPLSSPLFGWGLLAIGTIGRLTIKRKQLAPAQAA